MERVMHCHCGGSTFCCRLKRLAVRVPTPPPNASPAYPTPVNTHFQTQAIGLILISVMSYSSNTENVL